MKSKFLKATGALAVMALFAMSFATPASAQPVSMDEVQITQVGNLDDLRAKKKCFVGPEWVICVWENNDPKVTN